LVMVLNEKNVARNFSKFLMDPISGLSYDEPAPNSFSFNSPYGWCQTCKGLGVVEEITIDSIIPDRSLSISRGAIAPIGEFREMWIFKQLEVLLKPFKVGLTTPLDKFPEEAVEIMLYGTDEPVPVPSKKYEGTEWNTKYEGIINFLKRQQEVGSEKMQDWLKDFLEINDCPECEGARLKKEALFIKIDQKNIAQLAMMDITELEAWFQSLENRLNERQNLIAHEILKEIRKRIGFLTGIGLEYLTLNRPLRSLSGGEAQRIRLATQIGTQLTNVLYIMDEPSIGLHQRDNERLINALKGLRDLGNSVIVVEHDKDMMLASDFLVDIGPGAGRHGGEIVGQGTPQSFLEGNSTTAQFLKGEVMIAVPKKRRQGNGNQLVIKGATGNNLKNLTLKIPLGKMVCITGVSGSGKSTLIHETMYPVLNKHFFNAKKDPMPHKSVEGLEHLDKVIEVDQSPIGRTPRSNPATYTGMFSEIRTLFCELPESVLT
jgi:excinuclease ABC subunit A